MKLTIKHIALGAALTMVLCADLSIATAQETATAQKEEPITIGQMASGLNPMNWKMPQWKMPNFRGMLPAQEEKARIKKKKDGLLSEVTQTASNSWSRTKDALNPQKLNPANFFTASARTPSTSEKEETKPNFFSSLFTPAEEPADSNATVTDFLRQSRPSP